MQTNAETTGVTTILSDAKSTYSMAVRRGPIILVGRDPVQLCVPDPADLVKSYNDVETFFLLFRAFRQDLT